MQHFSSQPDGNPGQSTVTAKMFKMKSSNETKKTKVSDLQLKTSEERERDIYRFWISLRAALQGKYVQPSSEPSIPWTTSISNEMRNQSLASNINNDVTECDICCIHLPKCSYSMTTEASVERQKVSKLNIIRYITTTYWRNIKDPHTDEIYYHLYPIQRLCTTFTNLK